MKLVLILFGLATAAVFNRDSGKRKIKRQKLIDEKSTDYYEYDNIDDIKVEDIALGPVDAKAMMSQDTVRVPVSQLRVSKNKILKKLTVNSESIGYGDARVQET